MFGLGPMELALIGLIVLLVFGAKKIPEIAQGIGKGITEFKKAARDVTEELKKDDTPQTPVKNELRGQRIAEKPRTSAPVEEEKRTETPEV